MKLKERQIIMLRLENGRIPFELWYEKLNITFRRAIAARLTRLLDGNFRDHKSLGSGIFELRIPKGPGFRVYYGLRHPNLVVLISAGDKSSQDGDIKKAKKTLEQLVR